MDMDVLWHSTQCCLYPTSSFPFRSYFMACYISSSSDVLPQIPFHHQLHLHHHLHLHRRCVKRQQWDLSGNLDRQLFWKSDLKTYVLSQKWYVLSCSFQQVDVLSRLYVFHSAEYDYAQSVLTIVLLYCTAGDEVEHLCLYLTSTFIFFCICWILLLSITQKHHFEHFNSLLRYLCVRWLCCMLGWVDVMSLWCVCSWVFLLAYVKISTKEKCCRTSIQAFPSHRLYYLNYSIITLTSSSHYYYYITIWIDDLSGFLSSRSEHKTLCITWQLA